MDGGWLEQNGTDPSNDGNIGNVERGDRIQKDLTEEQADVIISNAVNKEMAHRFRNKTGWTNENRKETNTTPVQAQSWNSAAQTSE